MTRFVVPKSSGVHRIAGKMRTTTAAGIALLNVNRHCVVSCTSAAMQNRAPH